MKTLKTVILFSLMLAYGLTATADGKNDLIYNSEEVNGLTVAQTVYKMNNGTLVNYMKYSFVYDDQRRVVENISMKWNAANESWDNDVCLRYSYEGKLTTTEYYKWNAKKKQFVLIPGMTTTMESAEN